MNTDLNIIKIKLLGKEKSEDNLLKLILLFEDKNISLELKREIASSIGRQSNKNVIYSFIKKNFKLSNNSMDIIYQFYRTCLYNYNQDCFKNLADEIEKFYDNEMISKMKSFYLFKKSKQKFIPTISNIEQATLLIGDSSKSLNMINDKEVKLVFTSPPYYNAKEYSIYKSYSAYLKKMQDVIKQCYRVLEDGRFIVINVSPVITKRPGREFESIRYPIHFDFHKILNDVGFEFIDEIIWLKPQFSVPNRNGVYIQTQKPLSYKPNCVTESILIYRKKANFLLDFNIKVYKDFKPILKENFDSTNCWEISPISSKEHPAVFPKKLCENILRYYSFPNDVVLDPFAGSGTFGEVAKNMNRIPILCEKSSKYIEVIKNKGYIVKGK